jgi:thiol-disulfide isomerase/thioredoxin
VDLKELPHLTELVKNWGGDRQPTLVYFYSGELAQEKRAKMEAKMFGVFNLAYASHSVRFISVDADKIDDREMRRVYVPKTPALYFLDIEGEVIGRKVGVTPARTVLKLTHEIYHLEYESCVNQRAEEYQKVLKQLVEVEGDFTKAQNKFFKAQERAEKSGNQTGLAALERQVNELADRLSDLRLRETALLRPPEQKERAR